MPILGAKNIKQVESNINATKLKLPDKEYKGLSDLSLNLDLERY